LTDNAPAVVPSPPSAPEPSLLELAQQEASATPDKDDGPVLKAEDADEDTDAEAGPEPEYDEDGNPIESEHAAEDDSEEVEWEDGRKHRIPKGMKDALLRQADYTRKTQEVADTRKHVEAARAAVQMQAQIIDKIGPALAHRQDALAKLAEIDQKIDFRQLEAADPVKAQSWWRYREQLKEYVGNTEAQIQSVAQEVQVAQQQETARQLEYMNRVLSTKMPGWGQKRADQITEAAIKNYGFTVDEVASIREPRVVAALDDARKWREHVAKNKAPPKNANARAAAPNTVQPTEKLGKGASQGSAKKDPYKMSAGEYMEHRRAEMASAKRRDATGRFR
jgi:hypothetical protein